MSSSPPDPVDDSNIFSIIDDDQVETGENMVCGDDLPVYTSSVEYVDDNIPIMYTREQYLFHVLNTITYKTKVDDQAKWIRHANVYVDMLFDPVKCINNLHTRPIVLGHRYQILTIDESKDQDLIDDLKESNYVTTTMALLLDRRYVNRNTASYTEYIQHMRKIEQTFTSMNGEDQQQITAQYHVPFKSNCYVFQDYALAVDGKENGNHFVFEGDVLSVFGFVYKGNVINSDKNTFEWIDAEHYRSQLQSLVEGTEVYVYQHAELGEKAGRVKVVNNSRCEIQITDNNSVIEIDTMQIWKNNEFVFAKSNNRRFAMSRIVREGVAFSLLKDDEHGSMSIEAFVPSPSTIAMHTKEHIVDIPTLKIVLESHGYMPWDYMHVSQNTLSDVLTITNEPGKSNTREPLQFANFTAADNFEKMPDYGKYDFDPYRFERGFADTEFHRMMHLFHQGDAGLIHMLELLTLNLKSTKIRVDKYIDMLGAARTEEETVPSEDDPCTSHTRIYKKEYHSVESLMSDNNKVMEGVVDGDYAKLIEGDRVRDYKRNSGVWMQSHSHPMLKCNNLDDFPVTNSDLIRLDCLYDDLKMLCTSMQSMKDNVKRKNNIETTKMLQNTRDFTQNIDGNVLNMTTLKNEIGGMLKLYNAIESVVADRTLFHVPNHDYRNHIGNANAVDFEATYGNIDFSEQGVYTFAQQDDDDIVLPVEPNATDIHNTHLAFINAIVDAVGVVFGQGMLAYLVKQLPSTSDNAAAIEQKVSYKRDQLEALFKKNIRKDFKAQHKKEPTPADIVEQKRKFDAKLVSAMLDYKNKLIIKTRDSDKLALFNACGLIAVFAQIRLGYFHHINPLCRDRFHDGMAAYVSCVIHKMSIRGDKYFQPALGMTPKQIETLLGEIISRILNENENLSLAFEQKQAIEDVMTTVTKREMIDWPSFRPLIKEIHGSGISFVPVVKHSKRKLFSFKPALTVIPSAKLDGDRVLLISKPIVLPNLYDSSTKSVTTTRTPDLQKSNLPKKLIDAITSEASDEWDALIDESFVDFKSCMVTLRIKSKQLHDLFSTPKSEMSQVANSLRGFVCGELKMILGKLKSRWKLTDTDTASDSDNKLAKLIERFTNSTSVYQAIAPKLETSLHQLSNATILNMIPSTEFRMYAYLFLFVNVICNLSMKTQPLVAELVLFILSNYIESNEMNTYSPDKIKHEQEALREKSKEGIIARFEGMDEESRKAIQEIKKAGYKTLIDLYLGANAGDGDGDAGGKEVEEGLANQTNEDFIPFQGDNDDGNINDDVVDEGNDAWEGEYE